MALDLLDTRDLREAYFELVSSRPAYERAAAFYEGSVEEVYSSPKVKRLLAKFGLNSIESMNFAHIPVDAVANKLRINSVNIDNPEEEDLTYAENGSPSGSGSTSASGGPGKVKAQAKPKKSPSLQDSGNSQVNDVIEDLFEYNEFEEELPQLFKNTGKYGDYYMMVWPVVGDEDEDPQVSKAFDQTSTIQTMVEGEAVVEDNHVEAPTGKKSIVAVDMMILDPITTRVFYDPENPRRKKFAIRSWQEGTDKQNMVVRVNMYYKDRIERWSHKGRPSLRKESLAKWQHYDEDGKGWSLPNPFDEVPLFHFRTERTYGRPDHINAYGPQLAINKLVTSHLATVDYQSFPQRYALTDPTADQAGAQGVDSDPFAPEDGADIYPEDDDNESQLEADPGALWELKGMKAVGQFQAANPEAYLLPFDRYVKALAQVTDTPFHYFDRTGERPPSGENIRQVNETLIAKASARQTGYGSEIRKAVTFALNMLGHDVEQVNVEWEPLENVTSLVEWQAINEKQLAGVPQDVTLVEAGYQYNRVQGWMRKAEQQAQQERDQAQQDEERTIQLSNQAKLETAQANQKMKQDAAAKTPSASAAKPKVTPKVMAPKK